MLPPNPQGETSPHILYRKAITSDFEGILRLQHQNLLTTLQGEDLSQGFLSIEFTREQLHKMNSELGFFVAVQEKVVIGYLMAETAELAVGSPLMSNMLKRLKNVVFDGITLSSCFLSMDLSALTGNHGDRAFLRDYLGSLKRP